MKRAGGMAGGGKLEIVEPGLCRIGANTEKDVARRTEVEAGESRIRVLLLNEADEVAPRIGAGLVDRRLRRDELGLQKRVGRIVESNVPIGLDRGGACRADP